MIGAMAQSADVVRGRRNPLFYGLPERLKKARQAKGLSPRALSLAAGFSNPVVSNIENGRAVAGIDVAERLANLLGVAPCWLAYGYLGAQPFRDKVPLKDQRPEEPQFTPAVSAGTPLTSREVGARLRTERARCGISKKALAEAADISRSMVLYIEEGKSVPSVAMVEQLAGALSVSPCWLGFGDGEAPLSNAAQEEPQKTRKRMTKR